MYNKIVILTDFVCSSWDVVIPIAGGSVGV